MPRFRRYQKYFWVLLIAGAVLIICNEFINIKRVRYSPTIEMQQKANNFTFNKHVEAAERLKTCPGHKIPQEILVENGDWQILTDENVTFRMFNAYYDERDFYSRQNQSVVKIIALVDLQMDPNVEAFCQLWFDGLNAPIVSKVHEYKLMLHESGEVNDPYLVTCPNPLVNLGLIPSAVSLVVRDCDSASNYLKVIYNQPKTGMAKPVAVCGRLHKFIEDQTMMLVEWIEILLLLGVDKVFLYVIELHPKMMKALKFYEEAGKVKVEMTPLSGTGSQIPGYQSDVILYNDCFHRHFYEYEFLVPLDIDEIILPTGQDSETWVDLLTLMVQAGKLVKDELYSGYVVRQDIFLLDVGVKAFQNTKSVAVMSQSLPVHCLGQNLCDYFYIPIETAQLQHHGCESKLPPADCHDFMNQTVNDLRLWKFKDELLKNVNETLRSLA